MWLTKKILVATDFGEPSRAAAEIGLQLAQKFHVPLVLVHAYMVPGAIYMALPTMPAAVDYPRMYEEAARESLEKEGARFAGRGAEVTTVLQAGVAWEQILFTAKAVDADLIIVGTHGRRGLPRAILGSVAEKVVRLSLVPVLTIHAGPQARESRYESVT